MANVKELREKIAARKAERVAAEKAKFAKMRTVAQKAPEKLEACLAGLADKCASMAEGWENLRENLGLVKAAKEAPLKVRVAAARNYGKAFKRVAEEAPEKMAEALTEAYQGLNDIAADIEMAADQMGISLEAPVEESAVVEIGDGGPASFEEEVAENIFDEAKEEGESPEHELEEKAEGDHDEAAEEEEKEASGSEAWVTDRDESGQPKTPEQVDVPRVAASGSDSFVTDRDSNAQPEKPAKLEIPQAQGAAPTKASSKKNAEMLQEVGGGHAAEPAAEFVSEIPQSQGKSEAPGNKSASVQSLATQLKPMIKKAMSRKDYILLADAIRSFKVPNHTREELAKHLSSFLKRDNYKFSEGIFVDYAMGRGGSRGGNNFKGDQPNVPEELFV